jgi:chemotaxis signal transduction protein
MTDSDGEREASVTEVESTILLYLVGGRPFATDIHAVQALAPAGDERSLPGLPACFRGVTLIRGEPVGVVSVAQQLGLTEPEQGACGERHYLLVQWRGQQVAFAVQSAVRVLRVHRGAVRPMPTSGGDEACSAIAGLLLTEAGLTVLMDPCSLVSEQDMRPLRDIVQGLQAAGWSPQSGEGDGGESTAAHDR